jgi:hypothetical protein
MRRLLVVSGVVAIAACRRSAPPVGEEAPHGVPPANTWDSPAPLAVAPPTAPAASAASSPHGPHPDLPPGHPGVDTGDSAALALEGTIDVAPALKDQVAKANTIFVFAKSADASGNVTNPMPIAVRTYPPTALPIHFKLTGADSMTGAAGGFEGPVVVSARADGDGNATSKTPGDVEGKVAASIPATGLKIVLDTPLQ